LIQRWHKRPINWALVLVLAGVLGSAAPASAASRDDHNDEPGVVASRTAVLVYIAWQELEGASLDPTELRLCTTEYLTEFLSSQGHDIVPQERLAPLVTRWRMRSSLMLRDEFLTALKNELAVDQLLLAQLILQPGRLLVAWRLVDGITGTLLRVGFSESNLASDNPEPDSGSRRVGFDDVDSWAIDTWLAAAKRAAGSVLLDADKSISRSAGPYVVFPVRSVGSDHGGTILATHSLLEELVERGGLSLPDPGLVVTLIQASGFSAGQMNVPIRALLQDRFGSGTALIGELISYDIVDSRPTTTATMEDETAFGDLQQVDEFALSLTGIDLDSGRVLASNEVYENRSVEDGWFGVRHRHSLLERLGNTITDLWTETGRQIKDGSNDSPH
jgi:hypothetical protein